VGRSTFRKGKGKRDSKGGWILYLMVHFPFVWWVKIGITGRTAAARANDIDEAVFGFPIPLFVVFVPGAYIWEQMLHGLCRGLQVRFYKGDGSSEWFWFVAMVPALAFMLAVWGFYFWLVSLCVNWNGLEWYLGTLAIIGGWILELLKMV
jgi:hypothetical protein